MKNLLIRLTLVLQLFAICSLQATSWNSAWKSIKKQAAKLANDPAVQQAAGSAALYGLEIVSQKIDTTKVANDSVSKKLALEAAAGLVGLVQATVEAKLNPGLAEISDGLEQETDRAVVNLTNALDPNADQQAVAQESAELLEIAAEVLVDEESQVDSRVLASPDEVAQGTEVDGGHGIGLPPVVYQPEVVLNEEDLSGAFGPGEYEDDFI